MCDESKVSKINFETSYYIIQHGMYLVNTENFMASDKINLDFRPEVQRKREKKN